MTSNNLTKWIKKAEESQLSDSCIKGMAFYLGLNCHESKSHDQAEVDRNIEFFIEKSLCAELVESIDDETSFAVFYGLVNIFNSLSAALEVEFPKNRLDSNGKVTDLFTPAATSEIFLIGKSLDEVKLCGVHETYESFFEELGYVFSSFGFTAEQAFAFSDKFVVFAGLLDIKGFSFFDGLFKSILPPIFIGFLRLDASKQIIADDPLIPFQNALSGYLQGQDIDICNLIWNNQRVLFYNQQTLAPINRDYQWKPTVDFISLINAYFSHYWGKPDIVEFFRGKIEILSRYDTPLNDFVVDELKDFFPSILKRLEEKDGYYIQAQLSPSNLLQYKACFYFMFIFAYSANLDLLSKAVSKE